MGGKKKEEGRSGDKIRQVSRDFVSGDKVGGDKIGRDKKVLNLGLLIINLKARPEGISPRLPFFEVEAILEDGKPNLMSALRWSYRLVATLHGRDTDLTAIIAWAEGGGNTVSARLITGPGGSGKTRLAAEAARILTERGWSAGFLQLDAREGQVIDVAERAAGGGLLLIIDYPEERPRAVEGLFEHIADIANPPLPIRFLLVSRRSFEDWRPQTNLLGGRFGRQELTAARPLAAKDALAVLCEAAATFARLTDAGLPALDGAGAWLAVEPIRRLPLFATAAGVHAVLTGRGDFTLGAPELMREVAWREHQRVRQASNAAGLGKFGLERLLGAALMNPDGLDANRVTALGALDIAPGIAGQALLDALAATPWWTPAPLGGQRLARLEPDRPAAAFLEIALLGNPQPRLPDWIYAASVGSGGAFEPVLSRLAWDLSELSADGRGAVPLEQAVLAMIKATPERAADFRAVAYQQGTAFSAAFAARVVEEALNWTDDPAERAVVLNNLAAFLLDLGRREEALAAAKEAVELYLGLADAGQEDITPGLAMAFGNLAGTLSKVGRRAEALAAAEEAVKLYRGLAVAVPDAFTPDLAMALNNLAGFLSELGRREHALAAAEEAVKFRRRLAADRPEAFTPALASSLNNLSNFLSELGRREEALAAVKEAVKLRRGLAVDRPEAFTHYLATSLSNLAKCLSASGRREEALDTAEEALQLDRRLAAARPEAFTPNLADTLTSFASALFEVGQHEQALTAADEAVKLYRDLADARPEAFTPGLASSLHDLSNHLSELGRREEALAAAEEAVTLYRDLADTLPEGFKPALAASLNTLANWLSELGRRKEALAAAEEAVKLCRDLADILPEVFTPDLAKSLKTLGGCLYNLGRREHALAAAEEAVKLRRGLVVDRPEAFTPALASSLNDLAGFLSELGRRDEALAAAEEVVQLDRRLAVAVPDAFTPALAMALSNLAGILSQLGRREHALTAAEEAVELLSPFFVASAPTYFSRMKAVMDGYLEACVALERMPSLDLPALLRLVAEGQRTT